MPKRLMRCAGTDIGKCNGAAIAFTKKLTTTPQSMTDADIQGLSQFFSDRQIAEIVYHTATQRC